MVMSPEYYRALRKPIEYERTHFEHSDILLDADFKELYIKRDEQMREISNNILKAASKVDYPSVNFVPRIENSL